MNKRINNRMGVDYMVKVSVLAVLAFLIMLIELPLPFLSLIHISEPTRPY